MGHLVPVLANCQVMPDIGIYLVHLPNRTMPKRVRTFIDFGQARFKPMAPSETRP